jgi:hypothetical protein
MLTATSYNLTTGISLKPPAIMTSTTGMWSKPPAIYLLLTSTYSQQ